MTVKRVIFIRPGETDWNRDLRWQGWVAIPLNDLGKLQAAQLAKFIRNIGLSALYTSDLKRASQTAEILAEKLGFAPVLNEQLRERHIGNWQGLTPEEMEAWYPEVYSQLRADPQNFRVPGGESRQDVKARMLAAFKDIVAQDKGETVAVISHTTAINELLSEILGSSYKKSSSVSNSSVTTIRLSDSGVWELVASDDVLHLEGLETKGFPELEDKR